ncbi:MAG: nucleotidyltransferase domain-containing protein [Opitutales bacterium]|nr:nucleotidyltransferase domain-containing protein [Opitutales bacterium]
MNAIEQLFPKARAEILRLLFGDPDRSLHLRDLARSSGLAVGTIQREVAKLREAGLIVERRDGNRLYFLANQQHPIFPELQGIVLKTSGLCQQLRELFAGLQGIDLAFVYGSFAEGNSTADSDIDLFIIGTIGLRKLSPALRDLANQMEREINPNIYSRASFVAKLESGDAYICNVTNGKKLWIIGTEDELATMA